MNIIDNIVGFIIMTLSLTIMIAFITSIINKTYIRDTTYLAYGIHNDTERLFEEYKFNVDIDRSKEGYEVLLKQGFYDSFSGSILDLGSSSIEDDSYTCYNFSLSDSNIILHNEMQLENRIEFFGNINYRYTDEYGLEGGTTFINIACFYDTFIHIYSTESIDTNYSPINYVLYSLFIDQKNGNRITTKKGTLYFN